LGAAQVHVDTVMSPFWCSTRTPARVIAASVRLYSASWSGPTTPKDGVAFMRSATGHGHSKLALSWMKILPGAGGWTARWVEHVVHWGSWDLPETTCASTPQVVYRRLAPIQQYPAGSRMSPRTRTGARVKDSSCCDSSRKRALCIRRSWITGSRSLLGA